MKTRQTAKRIHLAAVLSVAAGLLTGALWSSQPASMSSGALHTETAVIDRTIPSITITGKRMSRADKERQAREEIDPTVPHLTVIGYRDRSVAALDRAL